MSGIGSTLSTFAAKPLPSIEAIQYQKDNLDQILAVLNHGMDKFDYCEYGDHMLRVERNYVNMYVRLDQWITREPGSYALRVLNDADFRKIYEVPSIPKDAIRWDGTNRDAILALLQQDTDINSYVVWPNGNIRVDCDYGQVYIQQGHWLVRRSPGDVYTLSPEEGYSETEEATVEQQTA